MRRALAASESGDSDPSDRPAPPSPVDPSRGRGRIIVAWVWVACWAAVIWVLGGDRFSLAETSRTIYPWLQWLIGDVDFTTRYKIFFAVRKSAHFIEYAILAILTFRAALLAAPRNQLATAAWVALFLVATLASADEARQAFSNTRSGSPYDVLIDVTGGAISVIGLVLIARRMRGTDGREASI